MLFYIHPYGAGGGSRTRMVSLPTDFESVASANSTTSACNKNYIITNIIHGQELYKID